MISVIVPVYNIEKYLSRAIDSILNQSVTEIEVILVNDGSTDSSGEICERYAEIDYRVKVLHKENGGIASARNKGLEIVSGEFICFIDGDDWIEKEMIEELLEPMTLDSSVDVCIGTHVVEMETGGLIDVFTENAEGCISHSDLYRQMLERTYWGWELCGKLYRKELFNNFRCNEKIIHGEDLHSNWRIFRRVKKAYYRAKKRYHYCMRPTSVTHEGFSEKVLTLVDVFNIVDDETDPDDKYLKRMNRERLLSNCIEVILKMFLLDSEKYRNKIIFYQEILRNKFDYYASDPNLSDIKKEQAKTLKSSFATCKQCFDKEYQQIVDSLRQFSKKYKRIYIYGAGIIAAEIAQIMKKEKICFDAFVVSDIKTYTATPDNEHEVIQFSSVDLEKAKDVGVILAMSKRNTKEVLVKLQGYHYRDILNLSEIRRLLLCNTGN